MLYSFLIIGLFLPNYISAKSCAWTDTIMSCVIDEPFTDTMFKDDIIAYNLNSYTFSKLIFTIGAANKGSKILFDLNTKAFHGIRVKADVELNIIDFHGFNGFENPLVKSGATNKMTVNVYSSYFDFYLNGQIIDHAQCTAINRVLGLKTFLNSVKSVICKACRTEHLFCPAIFKVNFFSYNVQLKGVIAQIFQYFNRMQT
jgi:hypothetical protein